MIVALYLAAIAAANLLTTAFGPSVSVATAFGLVAFDLTARDYLHERWRSRQLVPRMGALIATGSLIAFAVNRDAGTIALASCIAFAAASLADALVYVALERAPWLARANGSNVVGAAVDSLLFPTIAFGALLPLIVVGQFAAKVGGGALWSIVLHALSVRRRSL